MVGPPILAAAALSGGNTAAPAEKAGLPEKPSLIVSTLGMKYWRMHDHLSP
jgi:hypothetical protein